MKRALLLAAFLAWSGAAHADEPAPRKSPYRFRLGLDLPLVGLALAGTTAAFIEPHPPACLPHCEVPDSMNDLDRRVIGNYSPTAHRAADIVVASLLLAPHLANLVVKRDVGVIEDAAITIQSVLVAQAFTQIAKAAVDRYAPIVYDDRVPLDERTSKDALGSFWSGHTATAFSAATSFVVSYWLRNPRDPWRWVVLATLESAALSVGFLKIRAGYHYPSDIFAGALAGISSGVLVPMLHRRF